MLRRVTGLSREKAEISVGQASFPTPFAPGLEFNPPVHGAWNIVHIGMQVPEVHQIYVCAENCMRGVVLTAAEMNAAERFSCVLLGERDLLAGTVEKSTIEGTADVLRKLPKLPPAVMLFTVCVHHFLGCDLRYIYRELERQFPEVNFLRCYMDPICQKRGRTPEQKLRRAMFEPLLPLPPEKGTVLLLGGDFPQEPESDLRRLLEEGGRKLLELPDCGSYGEFCRLGRGETVLCTNPAGVYGVSVLAKRLGRPFLYLPGSFDYEEIWWEEQTLCDTLGIPMLNSSEEISRCDAALRHAREVVGLSPVAIDATVHPRPLGLARLLLEHGFRVETVYLDVISPEEKNAFRWLRENAPELRLRATIRPEMRVLPRGAGGKTLAIGQKAAWFEQTGHFVNLVQGGGLWGFGGVQRMAALIEDAWLHQKDTEDLVPRKGLGCESCI